MGLVNSIAATKNKMMDGVFVDWQLAEFKKRGVIDSDYELAEEQFEPNSVDLRVGPVAYRVSASFLPTESTVQARLDAGLKQYELDLTKGAILERGVIYLIPLMERLSLPAGVKGKGNPKSSTGRLDIFCRMVTDRAPVYDEVTAGYKGPLYLEVVPRSFTIRLKEGDRLSQLRLFEGDPVITDEEIENEIGKNIILRPTISSGTKVRQGLLFGVNLRAPPKSEVTIGFVAKSNHLPIAISGTGRHPIREYWSHIWSRPDGNVVLEPNQFYIFASFEPLGIGPDLCAEMMPYDAGMGELRSHYAGFFDSGFGFGSGTLSNIVLEVRNHHVPFLLSDRQVLFRLLFMRNAAKPRTLYGAGNRTSHYQGQGLKLAKQFTQNPHQPVRQRGLFEEARQSNRGDGP